MMKKLRYLFSTFLLLLVAGVTWAEEYSWDLSQASYSSATADLVTWSSDYATMTATKGTSTAANNYLPSTRTSSRFYSGATLKITPASGYEIEKVVFTATSNNYATALKNSTWSNASASASNTSVTVTPTNGTTAFSATIGGTCGFTNVAITYKSSSGANLSDPGLAFAEESGNVALDQTFTLPTLTNNGDGAVTYTSTETSVATINETSGAVTLVGLGKTTITATSAETTTYKKGTATYVLTVTPGGTLIWDESFDGEESMPEQYTVSDASLNTGDAYAGGDSPEVLVRQNGTFTANIPLQGFYGNLIVGFKSNRTTITPSTTMEGVTIGTVSGENPYYYTVTVPSGLSSLALTFTNTGSSNARVDDFVLYGITKSDKNNADLAFAQTSVSLEVGQTTTIAFTKATSAAVTFENSDPTVATYNEATGEVEALAAGETTITASSEETDDYTAGIATLVITVTEPLTLTGDGTVENPYTVADALALLADGQTPTGVYVKGIVSQVDEVSTQHGNATYWISDDGTTDNQMEAYRGKYLENANFTSEDQIQVGDEVVVTGNIVLYGDNKIPEFSQGNYLYSLTRNTPEVAKYYLHYGVGNDWDDAEFTYNNEAGTYTATLPVVNGTEFKVKYGLESASEFAWYGGDKGNEPTCRIHDEWYKDIPLITPGDNFEIQLSEPTTLTFTLTANPTGAPTLTVTGWPEPKYYLHYGTGNDWSDAEFTYNDEAGTYTATLPVVDGTEFKVKYGLESASEFTWYGGDKGNEPTCRIHDEWYKDIPLITPGDNFEIQLSEPTTLTFTLTANPTGAPTLTVTGWPEAPVEGAEKYVLVTDASELAEGDEIIFVAVGSATVSQSSVNFTKAMADANTEKHIFNVTDVTVNEDNTVTINDNVSKWTLGSVEGTSNWTFKNGNNYLAATGTDKNNYLETIEEVNANSIATIEFENNVASVIFTSDNRNVFSYNNNSDTGDNTKARFSCYAAVQNQSHQSLYIYKKQLLTTVDVTIGATGYATLYYSDMNLIVPEGETATTYKVAEGSLAESKTNEPNDVIPAATGVVLYTVKPATYSFTITSQAGEADADNMLQGTDAATTISEAGYKYYILSKSKDGQKIGFYYQNEDGSAVNNGAHKAYLPVPEAAAGGAKGWSFDGEATGIRSIEAGAGVENAVIYNLSGVRMNSQNLPKGIYIVNGKKMVVK